MKIDKIVKVPTGEIYVAEGEKGKQEKSMQKAWCEYRQMEYVDGQVSPLPSDNFKAGYILGHRDALALVLSMVS